MFDQLVFVESTTPQVRRRRTSAAISIAVQATVVLVMILVPLLHVDPPAPIRLNVKAPEFIPRVMRLITREKRDSATLDRTLAAMNAVRSQVLVVPTNIPSRILRESRSEAPYMANPCPTCAVGAGVSTLRNVIGANATPVVVHGPEAPRVIRISKVDEAQILRKVQPEYPAAAKLAHIQGPVVLKAVIATSGTMESVQVVSGNPLLARAALEAVRQWRYRPFMLNQRAVEVETEITVHFTMSQAQ